MTPQGMPATTHTLDLSDIYYVLFRHKWKILLCSIAGIAGALTLYRSDTPLYQSEAKLLVRYIVSGGKSEGPAAAHDQSKIVPDERGQSIMNTEVEILTR